MPYLYLVEHDLHLPTSLLDKLGIQATGNYQQHSTTGSVVPIGAALQHVKHGVGGGPTVCQLPSRGWLVRETS